MIYAQFKNDRTYLKLKTSIETNVTLHTAISVKTELFNSLM